MNGTTRPLILFVTLALINAFAACASPQTANETSSANASSANAASSAANSQPDASKQEAPVVASSPDANAQATNAPAPPAPPPQASEVRAALERIYKDAVVFDERAARFVVGDFNGDGSQDIAVAVRPSAAKLSELNDELSNWIVEDPRTVEPPDPRDFDPHEGVQKLRPAPTRARVEAADSLLVVIHGHNAAGWRNPEAMQTYLLKNGAGAAMNTQTRADAQAAAQTKLRLAGDVIQQRLAGQTGFLYWTGASYGWMH